MRQFLYFFLLCIILVSCKNNSQNQDFSTNTETNSDASLSQNIDKTIRHYLDIEIFSGVVLVAEKGDIIYRKAFGLADRENNRKNTLTTLFDIGSMNKTFTSIVIKQLAEEGKLKLSDKLVDYISGFQDPNATKITIDHLLYHESGFSGYHMRGYFDLPIEERKLNAIVERAKSYQLYFEPGTEQEYSNLGYVILGAVIEKVTGKSYFENVQKRIVDKLQLKNTYLQDFSGLESRLALGYYYTPLGKLEMSAPVQDLPNPDGGFLSTTEDIMRFYRSYYYDTALLSKSTKENDRYFKQISKLPKGKATGAFGGYEGFNSALYQVMSDDVTIIVFANMDEPVAELIAMDILRLSRGETPEKPQIPAVQNVRKHYEEQGIDYVKANFKNLIVNFHPTDPKHFILNMLGYAYLYEAKDYAKAIDIFKLNTELFPEEPNCWDSYGEALAKKGDKSAAIKAYEKALSLNPRMESAKEALQNLKQ